MMPTTSPRLTSNDDVLQRPELFNLVAGDELRGRAPCRSAERAKPLPCAPAHRAAPYSARARLSWPIRYFLPRPSARMTMSLMVRLYIKIREGAFGAPEVADAEPEEEGHDAKAGRKPGR